MSGWMKAATGNGRYNAGDSKDSYQRRDRC